jgi:phospholipid/cholesterol/gamma-HCH transport system substrate-binding protein
VLPRRIYLNLAAFAVLFTVLMVWAVFDIIRPVALEDTYPMRLQFDDATGLRTNVEVTYRGVRVGEITDVSLRDGGADVRAAIDGDRQLPAGVTAAIRRRSAVGEPYISLDAPPDWESGDAVLATEEGAEIPADRTSAGVAYGSLFDSAEDLLSNVDREDLGTVTSELAVALRDQGDELGRIIANTTDAASTFAEGRDELDRLAVELTALMGVLADKSPTIADATDDVTSLVGTLSSSADDIDALMARTPPVVSRMDELLVQAYGDLRCTAAGAAAISGVIDTDETLRQLTRFLRSAESAAEVIPKAIYEGPDGRYLSGTFGFGIGEFVDYDVFQEFDEPPQVGDCPTGAPDGPAGLVDAGVSDLSGGDGDGSDGPGDDDGADEDAGRELAGSEGRDDPGLGWLPAAVAGLLGACVVTAVVAALRKRWRKDGAQ